MDSVPEAFQGQLLIASPALVDPNFHRAVVLVTAHTDEGAMGLVLNRPSTVSVAEGVSHLDSLVEAEASVFLGGPVETSAVVALAEFSEPDQAAALVFGDVGFLSADADPDDLAQAVSRVRVFAGYAGWSAGQLEAELEQSAWFVEAPVLDEIFSPAPEALWNDVLRRKGGQYALVSLMPPDPSMN